MNVTTDQLLDTITPLVIALHERGVLDIAEVPHYYEDAVVRRREIGATDDEVAYQLNLVSDFQRLAQAVKNLERNRPRSK